MGKENNEDVEEQFLLLDNHHPDFEPGKIRVSGRGSKTGIYLLSAHLLFLVLNVVVLLLNTSKTGSFNLLPTNSESRQKAQCECDLLVRSELMMSNQLCSFGTIIAPAESAIRHSVTQLDFHPESSEFVGKPSPSKDKAWSNLLRCKHLFQRFG